MTNKPAIPPANDLPGSTSPVKKKELKHGFYSRSFTPEEKKSHEQDFWIALRKWEESLRQDFVPVIASLREEGLDLEKKRMAEQIILETLYAIKAIHRLLRIKYEK